MLTQQIKDGVKEAMKAGNSDVTGVLRLALSAISSKEKEKRFTFLKAKPEATEEEAVKESTLSEEEVIGVLASEIKKRRDAIALYEQGNRPELAASEKKEIEILQRYLPAQLSADEIRTLVQASIAATGAKEVKDMGKVMADLNPKVKGRAEGGEVSKIVKELLGS